MNRRDGLCFVEEDTVMGRNQWQLLAGHLVGETRIQTGHSLAAAALDTERGHARCTWEVTSCACQDRKKGLNMD